ncbi:MAG: hypothetical protein P8R37_11865 [Opitutae bacterium]|nr:hypothetical protein [Opitutae bacterium]MDG1302270.1 hypothetical protein [Opitutae bacterium]
MHNSEWQLATSLVYIAGIYPDIIFNIQHRWFLILPDMFNMIIYAFLGLFKIMVLVFNVVPFSVCLIIGT